MMRKIEFFGDSEAQLLQIGNEYKAIRPTLPGQFFQEFRAKMENICGWPETGTKVLKKFRYTRLNRFSYYIFYDFKNEVVRILYIIHTSRDPKVWKKFLRRL